jgi:psiF repeat
MRFSTVAAAACLTLAPVAWGFAAAPPPAQLADVPTAVVPAAGVPAAAKPSPAAATAPSSGDAAAKHAKRTACLKDAKAKKLVGADKTSFLKTCIAAP